MLDLGTFATAKFYHNPKAHLHFEQRTRPAKIMKTATVSPEESGADKWSDSLHITNAKESVSMVEVSSSEKPKHHQSLIGFDPLLTPTSVSVSTSIDTSFLLDAPPVPSIHFHVDEERLEYDESDPKSEVSPPQPNRTKKLQLSAPGSAVKLFRKKAGHRKTQSLTANGVLIDTNNSRFNSERKESKEENGKQNVSVSPPRPVRRSVSATTGPNPPPASSSGPLFGGAQRMLPWQKRKSGQNKGHRKTQSVTNVPDTNSPFRVPPQSVSASSSPVVNEKVVASMSPMIRELFKLDQEQQQQEKQSLFLPSLAPKPRPTSFLTGQLDETFRSSEQDPTPWQLEIPGHNDVLAEARLCQFLETYSVNECPLDFNQLVGVNRMDMQRFARGDDVKLKGTSDTIVAECHRPVVESLLECGQDISEVKGFFTSEGESPDNRREVLVVERQNKFLCVFRGSAAEQQGKFPRQSDFVKLNDESNTSVFMDRLNAFASLQANLFPLLDQLTEESPFCDITFTGHSYGAAVATLAAYTYANSHTALRVACHVTACPRLGQGDFRSAVHSTPNLNVLRVELGRFNHRWAAGHLARLIPRKDGKSPAVQVFKFGLESHQENLPIVAGASAVRSFLAQGKEKGIHEYIDVLEDVGSNWAKDFYLEDGKGVRGKDNEAREMA